MQVLINKLRQWTRASERGDPQDGRDRSWPTAPEFATIEGVGTNGQVQIEAYASRPMSPRLHRGKFVMTDRPNPPSAMGFPGASWQH